MSDCDLSGATRPQAPFGRRLAQIGARREHGPYVVLTAHDLGGPLPLAGQFYMLSSAERWGGEEDGRPYLPRALSFARASKGDDGVSLDFLFEAVGPGTRRLSRLRVGEELSIAGPFGNGFAFDTSRAPVLVAGGVGLAPIVALDDEIRALDGPQSEIFIGMRSAAHAEAIEAYGLRHELATEDGSAGRQGFVTEPLSAHLATPGARTVYACGPPAMLEAVRALCAEHDVPAQLAMESGMACGFGACYGCVVPTKDGYTRLCVDGPVVAGSALDTAITVGGH